MADITVLDRDAILRVVRAWPPDEQRALAGEILRHAGIPTAEEPGTPPNSAELAGILATGRRPPNDAEIDQWLDERRTERYDR